MQIYFNKGATMRVCGGAKEIHGFNPDEIVVVMKVRKDPELSHVALCKSTSRNHEGILMIEEVEDL